MKRAAAPLLLLPALLAPPALAQEEEPAEEAEQARGRLVLRVDSGIDDRNRTYVAKGQRVEVRGALSEYAPRQYVVVTITRGGREARRRRMLIRKDDDVGRFTYRFTARRSGRYLIRAFHEETPEQVALFEREAVTAVSWSARPGQRGARVRVLQRGLDRLAFVTSRGGRYDAATGRAVLAFRKTNRMARTTRATREVFEMLLRGRGGFRLKYPNHGKHVETDLSRQVLVLARDGEPVRIYPTSSGTSATPTVLGSFRFYRKQPGTNSLGMVHSNYFIRGYAIHGYKSVPTHPASHGCLRVPIPNARSIDRWIDRGDRIDVYR
ncbi:MAG: L,D-transpeptidase [Thermoleophilaceae bacterium]